jgi:hypothetical protein
MRPRADTVAVVDRAAMGRRSDRGPSRSSTRSTTALARPVVRAIGPIVDSPDRPAQDRAGRSLDGTRRGLAKSLAVERQWDVTPIGSVHPPGGRPLDRFERAVMFAMLEASRMRANGDEVDR